MFSRALLITLLTLASSAVGAQDVLPRVELADARAEGMQEVTDFIQSAIDEGRRTPFIAADGFDWSREVAQ